MPSHEYELTTPLSVKKEEALAILQDPKQFLISGGATEEDSIKYDEKSGKWYGTAKGGIPLIPKPSWSATYEETSDGSHWVIDGGYGITTEHTWSVEGTSGDEVCYITEKGKITTPLWLFHGAKYAMLNMQKATHKNMQEYFS